MGCYVASPQGGRACGWARWHLSRSGLILGCASAAVFLCACTSSSGGHDSSSASGRVPTTGSTLAPSNAPRSLSTFRPPAGFRRVASAKPVTSGKVTPSHCADVVNGSQLLPAATVTAYANKSISITVSTATLNSADKATAAVTSLTAAARSCPAFHYGSVAFTATPKPAQPGRPVELLLRSAQVDITLLAAAAAHTAVVVAVAGRPPGAPTELINSIATQLS